MLRSACIALALFLFTALANAQVPTSGNIFFGYSFENTGSTALDGITRANLQGWEGSLEGKLAALPRHRHRLQRPLRHPDFY